MANTAYRPKPKVQRPVGLIVQSEFNFLPEAVLNEILKFCAESNDPRWFGQQWPCNLWCPKHAVCLELFDQRMESSDLDSRLEELFEKWMLN